MKIFRWISALGVLLLGSATALADYNANFGARITEVLTYDGGHFLILTNAMPAGPCSHYWVIPNDIPADARQMMLARAMIAREKGEVVNIGYDQTTCVNGWYRVHRIG